VFKCGVFRAFSWIVLTLFLSGCSKILGDGWIYEFVDYGTYKSGKVIDAQPVGTFSIPAKKAGTDYLQFFALGCAGTGNPGQKIVAREMAEISKKEDISFALYLGDNFYPRGVGSVKDPKWQEAFEDVYAPAGLEVPFYSVLGNHDHYKNPAAQVEYSQISEQWNMPALYYSFSRTLGDGTRVDFFALDIESIIKGKDKEQLVWLAQALEASTADWKIVFGHNPVFTGDRKRRKGAEEFQPILLPVLVENGADLYLSAHSHTLEVMEPVEETHFVISGAGSFPRNIVYWTDQTLFAYADLGFAWLRVSKEKIEIMMMAQDQELKYVHTIER